MLHKITITHKNKCVALFSKVSSTFSQSQTLFLFSFFLFAHFVASLFDSFVTISLSLLAQLDRNGAKRWYTDIYFRQCFSNFFVCVFEWMRLKNRTRKWMTKNHLVKMKFSTIFLFPFSLNIKNGSCYSCCCIFLAVWFFNPRYTLAHACSIHL